MHNFNTAPYVFAKCVAHPATLLMPVCRESERKLLAVSRARHNIPPSRVRGRGYMYIFILRASKFSAQPAVRGHKSPSNAIGQRQTGSQRVIKLIYRVKMREDDFFSRVTADTRVASFSRFELVSIYFPSLPLTPIIPDL